MIRRSYTAVIERNVTWAGQFETEPYEAAWASEAIFFVRTLASSQLDPVAYARVQISPDGIHWCDEGETVYLSPEPAVTFCRVRHFGGWLRLVGQLPPGSSIRVIVYLALKE